MSGIKNFFTQLLSIDESRKSIVVIILIAVTTLSIYKAFILGGIADIPPNCMTIVLTLSGLVFGTNAVTSIAGIVQASKGNNSNTQSTYPSAYPNYSALPTNTNNQATTHTTPSSGDNSGV
jgi:hypothetical protein